MFQYAFVRKLELDYGVSDIAIDDSFFAKAGQVKITQYGNSIDDFNVHLKKASSYELKKVCLFAHNQKPMTLRYRVPMLLEMILNKKYYHVRNYKYVDPKALLSYKYLDGSWQSWKYLQGIEEVLRKEFTVKKGISHIIQAQIEKTNCENAVFIGIRRGDYVINKANSRLYGEISEKYFNAGIRKIMDETKNPHFYVMSDDIDWVKNNINFAVSVTYREGEMVGIASEELMFMASCKHAIIPNSTFHWWGAWLISNPEKIVIAPRNWFADETEIDILPPEWITFDRN